MKATVHPGNPRGGKKKARVVNGKRKEVRETADGEAESAGEMIGMGGGKRARTRMNPERCKYQGSFRQYSGATSVKEKPKRDL